MNDNDVREMLRRRAGEVTTTADAWRKITDRIGEDDLGPGVLEFRPPSRRFNLPAVGASIAAALLIVVASLSVIRDSRGDEKIRAADGPSPSSAAGPPPAVPFEAAAEAAAHRWVRALAAGDARVVWDLLAERSREAVGGRSGIEARLAEVAAAWAGWDSPEVSYRVVALADDGADGADPPPTSLPRLGAVILSRPAAQGRPTATKTISLPVRGTSGDPRVEPFMDGLIELDAADGSRVGPRPRLGAFAPSGARVWFVLDDRAPVGPDDSQGADGDQQHATVTPAPALPAGPHSFTVVVVTVDGRLASRSAGYTVA